VLYLSGETAENFNVVFVDEKKKLHTRNGNVAIKIAKAVGWGINFAGIKMDLP
jgi:hypothetical protein